MRKSGDWMSVWDDRILEYIENKGSGSPSKIAESDYMHVSKQHISRRLSTLAEHDLLEALGNGVYTITREGRHYLAGGYDAEREAFMPEIEPERGVRNYQAMYLDLMDKISGDGE